MLSVQSEKPLLGYIICMALAMIFAFSWQTATLDCDSYNYAVVAQRLLQTGNPLNIYDPVYDGAFYYHFPLCIWATAFFFKVLGVNFLSAKLFSMLSALLACAGIFYLGKKIKNSWVGFFAAWSFLLTNHVARLSRQCRMDLPVSLFILLALFAFIMAQRRHRYYYILFGIASCLAIFAKDITGTAPLPIAVLYFIFTGKFKEIFSPWFILGCLLAVFPVAGWVLLEKALYNTTLFDLWFRWNFLHLITSPGFNVPWHYYIGVLFTKYWYFLPFAVWGGFLALREEYRDKNKGWLVIVIWALFFPFVFSFGRQKLHYFILPMYPAAALLVGLCCDKMFSYRIKVKLAGFVKYGVMVCTLLMLCLPLKLYTPRSEEYVVMGPAIAATLKANPEHEFIICRVDKAALLVNLGGFYEYKYFGEVELLERYLLVPSPKTRFACISGNDFQRVSETARKKLDVLFRYKKILLIAEKDKDVTAYLPPSPRGD